MPGELRTIAGPVHHLHRQSSTKTAVTHCTEITWLPIRVGSRTTSMKRLPVKVDVAPPFRRGWAGFAPNPPGSPSHRRMRQAFSPLAIRSTSAVMLSTATRLLGPEAIGSSPRFDTDSPPTETRLPAGRLSPDGLKMVEPEGRSALSELAVCHPSTSRPRLPEGGPNC